MSTLSRWSWIPGLLGAFCFITFASLFYVYKELNPWVTGFGIAAGVLIGIYGIIDRERVADATTTRAFRYGAGSVLLVLVALVIAGIGYQVVKQHDHRWDLTGQGRFTLSDQTRSVLDGLDTDVSILAFFRRDSAEERNFKEMVEAFEQASSRVNVEFVDPLRNPMLAQEYTITTEYGTVVLVAGEDRQRIEADFGEESLTAAMVRLLSGEDHRLCWSVGHGEADPDDDYEADGLGAAVLKLEDLNYTVEKTQIVTQGIDRGCEALLLVRPQQELLPVEREAVAAYVAEGGRLFVLLEPGTTPELAAEMERYGARVGDDIVLDLNPLNRLLGVDDPSFLVLSDDNLHHHAITESMTAVLILGVARSVSPIPDLPGLDVTELLTSSEDSWGETQLEVDADSNELEVQPDPGVDIVGNVPLMVVTEVTDPSALEVARPRVMDDGADQGAGDEAPGGAEEDEGAADSEEGEGLDAAADSEGGEEPDEAADSKDPEELVQALLDAIEGDSASGGVGDVDFDDVSAGVPTDFAPEAGGRVVVIGDSDFAGNRLMLLGNNQDLFLNTVAWLVEEEHQIGARPEEEDMQTMSLNLIEEALLWLVSVFLVPGLALVGAVGMIIRRRFL